MNRKMSIPLSSICLFFEIIVVIVCVCTCMYAGMCACIYVCMSLLMCVYVSIYVYAFVYVCVFLYVCIGLYMCVHVYICLYVCIVYMWSCSVSHILQHIHSGIIGVALNEPHTYHTAVQKPAYIYIYIYIYTCHSFVCMWSNMFMLTSFLTFN